MIQEKTARLFFCYGKESRTIEVIRYNFDRKVSSRIVLYTSKPILEVKFISDPAKDKIYVFGLTKEKGKLFIQSFEIKDFLVTKSEVSGLAVNVENATFSLNDNKSIYSLARYSEKYVVNKTVYEGKIFENNSLLSLPG